MKQLIAITGVCLLLMAACSASRKNVQVQAIVNDYGKDEQLADTFLQKLQQENDVVIAAYTQNMSWGLHVNYTIAARKGGVWKGYLYNISGTLAKRQAQASQIAVNAKTADSLLVMLNSTGLWRGRDNHETCNMQVSDGSTSYLLMASPSKVLRVSYYMPESYQKFCPDSSRQIFLDAFDKMQTLVEKGEPR